MVRHSPQKIDENLRAAGKSLKVVQMIYKSEYADPDEAASDYKVEPYSYRNKGKTFFGFDQMAKSIKAFKVANIVSVELTNESFKPRWPVELK
jgi:predicted DNA-binding transcriptional regulator YafY